MENIEKDLPFGGSEMHVIAIAMRAIMNDAIHVQVQIVYESNE
jgi:hypothetical protein